MLPRKPRPPGCGSEHLEVLFTPVDPVTITRAGGGPPQRGDHFYVDGPIFAAGDVNGTQIGTYQCFGAWTTAADDALAPNQRLTTVQFLLDDGAIVGLANEVGTERAGCRRGPRGNRPIYGSQRDLPAAPDAKTRSRDDGDRRSRHAGAGQNVVRAVFELILPQES